MRWPSVVQQALLEGSVAFANMLSRRHRLFNINDYEAVAKSRFFYFYVWFFGIAESRLQSQRYRVLNTLA
jgi:hypothetical protein